MTMLTAISPAAARAFAWRTAIWFARGRRCANRVFATVVVRHERHAARIALHRLDDRQLQDIGLARSEIDARLEEVAQMKARMQQPGWH